MSTKQICYIVPQCSRVILSLEACLALRMLTPLFPGVEKQAILECTEAAGSQACTCPRRAETPDPPATMPFPATEENRGKLEAWILEHYQASAFNTCDHQPLPMMHGEPMSILVDPAVTPRAVHKPVPVPLHWHEEVKQQLESDCRLGVIERVPVGTPVTWCSPMVVVPKHDGSPRRTVDMQALNDASVHQTHHTESPFHLASRVPHNTKKTVLDAWNGYHSVALRPEDSHYTTFITPWGRFRYLAAPMGYLAAGDAYTHRYDKVIAEVKDVLKCVDDALLHDVDLEKNFWKTCSYISLCGKNRITFNPKKFQFGQDEVRFAGFEITKSHMRPQREYLQAILDFPKPTDITGVRS